MFFGKVLALGLAGLVQTAIWLLSGYGMLRVSGRVVEVLENFRLPAEFWLWTLAFFLAGYLLYASLMAGIGALTPNLREASQMTLIVNLPLMIPLVASGLFALSPNQALLTVLSFIPLTAPLAMVQRMVLLELPTWQPILSILLLGLTGAMVIRGTAGLFRAQTLLQGGSAWERLGRQLGWRREVRI
jgi:ABC-2 type transport system permease protein